LKEKNVTTKKKNDKHKESNNSDNPKKNKFINFLESTIITALLIAGASSFWNTYTTYRSSMFTKYDELIRSIEKNVFMVEDLYVFCEETKKLKPYPLKYYIEMYKFRETMLEQFENISDKVRSLGKFLPYENYVELKQLTYWNDQVLFSPKGICDSGMLVSPDKMDKWKNTIVNNLVKEKIRYKGLRYSLDAYFVNIFTLRASERHDPPKIDLSKSPIYQ